MLLLFIAKLVELAPRISSITKLWSDECRELDDVEELQHCLRVRKIFVNSLQQNNRLS